MIGWGCFCKVVDPQKCWIILFKSLKNEKVKIFKISLVYSHQSGCKRDISFFPLLKQSLYIYKAALILTLRKQLVLLYFIATRGYHWMRVTWWQTGKHWPNHPPGQYPTVINCVLQIPDVPFPSHHQLDAMVYITKLCLAQMLITWVYEYFYYNTGKAREEG